MSLAAISLVLAIVAGVPFNYAGGEIGAHHGGAVVATKAIEQVLKEHTRELMSIPGVVGIAEGRYKGRPCIDVYVVAQTPELKKRIPASLEGYPVVVKETGEIRILPEERAE